MTMTFSFVNLDILTIESGMTLLPPLNGDIFEVLAPFIVDVIVLLASSPLQSLNALGPLVMFDR